jgi:O-antigen ligase
MTSRREASSQGITMVPLLLLCLVYVGLLSGDQPVPWLSGTEGFPEVRLVVLLGALALLPGLLLGAPRPLGAAGLRFLGTLGTFLAYMCLTSLWSPPGAEADRFFAEAVMIFLFTGVAMIAAARMDASSWRVFWLMVVVVSVVFALGGLANGSFAGGRMSAFGSGPNVYVRIVGVGAVVGAFHALRSGRVAWLAVAALLSGAAVLTGSRGGILALSVTLLIGLVLGYRWLAESRRVLVFALGATAVILAVSAALGERIREVVALRFGEQLLSQGQTAGRNVLYEAGWEMWRGAPLRGNGVGSFEVVYGHGFAYTHNIVLDVLVDGGLLGLLLLAIVVVSPGPGIWSTRRGIEATLSSALGIFYLAASQFSGTYYDTRFAWFFLGIGCVAMVVRTPDSRTDARSLAIRPWTHRRETAPVGHQPARRLGDATRRPASRPAPRGWT